MSCKPRQLNKFISLLSVSLGGALSFATICLHRGDETFYSKLLMPIVTRFVDPELAHGACIFLTKYKLIRCQDSLNKEQAEMLKSNVFGKHFKNPVGVAAGFDKNAEAVNGLSCYGLGFAEVGTVTPEPQDGNPRKRIFRVLEDLALINRCGFNNRGSDDVFANLSLFLSKREVPPTSDEDGMLVGLNLGKNKDTKHISEDYLVGIELSKNLDIDYYVINISSPNTAGLRDLQEKEKLEQLLFDILTKMHNESINTPLLVKIAPDLNEDQIKDIADVLMKMKCGDKKVSGIILTNTTVSRPKGNLKPYDETGGLSGAPLRDMSTRVISEFYRLTKGQLTIIGVGGVASGQDAYDKIKAGASLFQVYTSLTYEGPPVVNKIKRELVQLLECDKLSLSEAVGLNHRTKPR